MSLFLFLTVVQAIVAFALVCVVLMQRSEGGGLGIGGGGSPGGLMSARGAADFLTKTTKWLAILFVGLSIALAAVAIRTTSGSEIDDSLDRSVSTPTQPVQGLAPAGEAAPADAAAGEAAPAQDDALSGVAE
jgi:preprotein translocase subunit SecG